MRKSSYVTAPIADGRSALEAQMHEIHQQEATFETLEEATQNIQVERTTMHATRTKRSIWTLILIRAPISAVEGVRHVSQSAYEAGRSLLTSPKKQKAEIVETDFKRIKALSAPHQGATRQAARKQ